MKTLDICCEPLNPDHRPLDMAYVVGRVRLDVVIVVDALAPLLQQALNVCNRHPAFEPLQDASGPLPLARKSATSIRPDPATIASILYTCVTTGRLKGCLSSHGYELAADCWYATREGLIAFGEACERNCNPPRVFHVIARVFSFYCARLKGNCQIQTDRFQPSRSFVCVHESRATVVHYLSVVVPMLLSKPPHALEGAHLVRFAIGAGVDPQRHAEFEQRFGNPQS